MTPTTNEAIPQTLRQQLAGVEAELERAQRSLAALVHHVGTPGECRGCHAAIVWIRHRNQKLVPYNPDGVNHFVTCPEALQFKANR